MLQANTKIPALNLQVVAQGQIKEISTGELFAPKTILFGVPGAFTPTCSNSHLPSFVKHEDALRAKGYAQIVCLSVNDVFVMQAWKQQVAPDADIIMLADGSAAFTKAMDLVLDLTEKHLGVRCHRFVAVIENGTVVSINVEENPGVCTVSAANALL